jgi:F-type H+-transporting ATPase subunit a
MNGMEVEIAETWRPLEWLGIHHQFFNVDRGVVINTWIILVILILCLLPVRWLIKKRFSISSYLILSFTNLFIDMTKQSLGFFDFGHFAFVTALFIFIALCNIISIIPYMEEPTASISTTLSLGITMFIYVQYQGIKAHGVLGYLKEFIDPIFVMAPMHLISKLASIISISCRLFGNIFGGMKISVLWFSSIQYSLTTQILGFALGLNFLIIFFFGLFEGFLQAFVFTMLTLTYLSLAVQKEHESIGAEL